MPTLKERLTLTPERSKQIFLYLLMFVGLTWLWTLAFFKFWPWTSEESWQEGYPLIAQCVREQASTPCTLIWHDLPAAKAEGKITSLELAQARGEMQEDNLWVTWSQQDGLTTLTLAAWFGEEGVRYQLQDGQPQILAHRLIDLRIARYAMLIALINVLIIAYFRLRAKKEEGLPTTF